MNKHRVYFGGRIKAIIYTNEFGYIEAVVVAEPGYYDFGISKRELTLLGISGKLEINDRDEIWGESRESFTVYPGDPIRIKVDEVCVYRCHFC